MRIKICWPSCGASNRPGHATAKAQIGLPLGSRLSGSAAGWKLRTPEEIFRSVYCCEVQVDRPPCLASIEHDRSRAGLTSSKSAHIGQHCFIDLNRTRQTSFVVHASPRQLNPCLIMEIEGDGRIGGNSDSQSPKRSVEFKGGAAC